MINECVHERSVSRLVSRNSELSDSLKAHISQCENCTRKYNILCHENSVLKENVSSYKSNFEIKETLSREVELIVERYAEKSKRDARVLKNNSFGSLNHNVLAFVKRLTQPISLILMLFVGALYFLTL